MPDHESMNESAAPNSALPAARAAIMQGLGLTQRNEALTVDHALKTHGMAACLQALEVALALLEEGEVRGVGNLRLTPMEVWMRCVNNPPSQPAASAKVVPSTPATPSKPAQSTPAVSNKPAQPPSAPPTSAGASRSPQKRPQPQAPSDARKTLARAGQQQQLRALIDKRGWSIEEFTQYAKKPPEQLTEAEATLWIAQLNRATYGKPRPKPKTSNEE